MRLTRRLALLLVLFSFIGVCSGQDSTEDESEQDYDISLEPLEPYLSAEDDKPDIICEKDGYCNCIYGDASEGKKEPNVVNCTSASLKGSFLDTAHVVIRTEKFPNFKAQEVRMSHNRIHVLRKGLIVPGHEDSIISLDFTDNLISDVERYCFDNFPKLVKLKLTNNQLRYEEISIDWLTAKLGQSLHQLYLDNNRIKNLDDGIFDNLKNLNKLVLDGNKGLRLTPKTFGRGLKRLRILSMDNCGFDTLDPEVFANLGGLTQLSLSRNRFNSVPLALRNVPRLNLLALSEAFMTHLPQGSFKNIPALKSVFMRRMPNLTEVMSCAFCGLIDLESVDFSGSKGLAKIDDNAFGLYAKKEVVPDDLNMLDLRDCNFTGISENLLDWGPPTRLALAGNPLHCDCETMKWLLGNRDVNMVGPVAVCKSPAALREKPLRKANAKQCGLSTPASSSLFDSNMVLIFLVAVCGIVLVVGAGMFAKHKGVTVSQFLPAGRNQSSQLGYSNLGPSRSGAQNDIDEGDENRLEDDFNRPEFV
ncbi:leucine rich repeat domain-containing protein [Ditylenchus destructor]|nr:leucine rich repeat domain-containing protein [Ditylenchus destructor]